MNRNLKKIGVFTLVTLGSIQISKAQKAPQLGKDSLEEVIEAMTAEEKQIT